MEPIQFGAHVGRQMVSVFFLMLALDISVGDSSLATDTLLELDVPWVMIPHPCRSIWRTVGKLGDPSTVLVTALSSLSR